MSETKTTTCWGVCVNPREPLQSFMWFPVKVEADRELKERKAKGQSCCLVFREEQITVEFYPPAS